MKKRIIFEDESVEVDQEVAELFQNLIRRIAGDKPKMRTLSEAQVGEVVKIGGHELIVLEQSGDTTALIRKGLLTKTKFGQANCYTDSNVDKKCIEFAAEIESVVGEENIVLHEVDLTANDGLKDYGQIYRNASLLTAERYRRYVEILDKHNPGKWWWIATPYSTKRHDNDNWALCVSPSGFVSRDLCNYYDGGVRPFCILKSSIFVSK